MTHEEPSLELIVYQLSELRDDVRQANKDRRREHEGLELRVRTLEVNHGQIAAPAESDGTDWVKISMALIAAASAIITAVITKGIG